MQFNFDVKVTNLMNDAGSCGIDDDSKHSSVDNESINEAETSSNAITCSSCDRKFSKKALWHVHFKRMHSGK